MKLPRYSLRTLFVMVAALCIWVITGYRNTNANLRTQLNRILAQAGVKPWPRLFQNLRSSAESEWAEEYGDWIASKWAGNSTKVARRHYLQVPQSAIEKASGQATSRSATIAPRQLAPHESKLAQAISDAMTTTSTEAEGCVELPPSAMTCNSLPLDQKWAVQDSNL